MDIADNNIETMEVEQLQNYQQMLLDKIFTQKLEQNTEQIKIWNDYKNRHEKVIEGLQVYPLSVSVNCMVPIGKRALMKGKLTHTNEVLVCLGDSYFAKYTASQAIALCNRRIAWADEILKSLETERNLYEMKQIFPLEYDVFGENDKKDILEHWNEEKLDEWRVQHRQREKEYHQKVAKLEEKEKVDICSDKDLFSRLDELELLEEFEDETYRLEAEQKGFYGDDLEDVNEDYEGSEEDIHDSDENTTEMFEGKVKKLRDIRISRVGNNTSADFEEIQDGTVNTDATNNEVSNLAVSSSSQDKLKEGCVPELKDISKGTNTKKKRKVSFAETDHIAKNRDNTETEMLLSQEACSVKHDDTHVNENSEDEDVIRIEFSHSQNIPNIPESDNTEIQSPLDIYRMCNYPKSILKRSPNDMISNHIAPLIVDDSTDTEDEDNYVKKPSAYNSVIKDVQERKVNLSINSTKTRENMKKEEKKIISKFKMQRDKIKK